MRSILLNVRTRARLDPILFPSFIVAQRLAAWSIGCAVDRLRRMVLPRLRRRICETGTRMESLINDLLSLRVRTGRIRHTDLLFVETSCLDLAAEADSEAM